MAIVRSIDRDARHSWRWLLAPIEKLRRHPYELLKRPSTTLARVGGEIAHDIAERITRLGLDGFVREIFEWMPAEMLAEGARKMDAHHRKERSHLCRTAVGAQLFELIDAAHAAVPNSPLLLLPHPYEHGEAVLTACGYIQRIHGERGEARARLCWSAAASVSEPLYRSYLGRLWGLADLAERRWPRDPPGYGKLVELLQARLPKYAALIEPDCAHVRNAVAHGHVRYEPHDATVALWGAHDWNAKMRPSELEALTKRMLKGAGETYQKVIYHFVHVHLLSALIPLLPSFLAALKDDDTVGIERFGAEIDVKMNAMYTDVRALREGAASAPSRTKGAQS